MINNDYSNTCIQHKRKNLDSNIVVRFAATRLVPLLKSVVGSLSSPTNSLDIVSEYSLDRLDMVRRKPHCIP